MGMGNVVCILEKKKREKPARVYLGFAVSRFLRYSSHAFTRVLGSLIGTPPAFIKAVAFDPLRFKSPSVS